MGLLVFPASSSSSASLLDSLTSVSAFLFRTASLCLPTISRMLKPLLNLPLHLNGRCSNRWFPRRRGWWCCTPALNLLFNGLLLLTLLTKGVSIRLLRVWLRGSLSRLLASTIFLLLWRGATGFGSRANQLRHSFQRFSRLLSLDRRQAKRQ